METKYKIDSSHYLEEFHRAIEKKEIILVLQPKFAVNSKAACGAEILCRWNHPEKGILTPKDFLPQCDQFGLMEILDYYVWEHSLQILKKWMIQGSQNISFSVKISKDSLYKSDTTEKLIGLLEKYQVPKKLLQLEIEEDSIRGDIYQAKEAINHLRNMGFCILLDDFSYGCSSISALNQMMVDTLKVDMKFFSSEKKIGIGESILAGIIKSVKWHGMKVLAECVETNGQNEFAKIHGCDIVQGFFFSKPIPLDEFEEKYCNDTSDEIEQEEATLIQENESESNNKPIILVIDDVEMERELLKKFLQDEFHVQLCESAEQGLEYLNNHKDQVHMILVDYIMPKMNGLEFLQFCQLDERLQQIPKIMITSDKRAEDQVYAFQAGACDYLLKPLFPELVKIRVHHAMEISNKLVSTELEKQEYQHIAEIDKATGVLNKISFQSYVEKSLHAKDTCNALLIIDIDDLKQINDTQGHLFGDSVIKLIASQLSSLFRSSDYVGRFGGDEFTVYMTNISDRKYAQDKAITLLKKIEEESQLQLKMPASISVGIGFSKKGDRFEQLFQRTDQALYQAKKMGKGRCVSSSE